MAVRPTDEDLSRWHRWFAVECNNLAWSLAESQARTPADDATMLAAAYASSFHWSRAGTAENAALCEILLGQVHALLGHGDLAMHHALRAQEWVVAHDRPSWEIAFAHAVLANAAYAAGDRALHAEHYAMAEAAGKTLGDVDRSLFDATFRLVPAP